MWGSASSQVTVATMSGETRSSTLSIVASSGVLFSMRMAPVTAQSLSVNPTRSTVIVYWCENASPGKPT